MDPSNAEALVGKGVLLMNMGRYGEALGSFQAFLGYYPDSSDPDYSRVEELAALCSQRMK